MPRQYLINNRILAPELALFNSLVVDEETMSLVSDQFSIFIFGALTSLKGYFLSHPVPVFTVQ